MRVLLSIKPEFADLILNGTKKYEYRRVIFQDPRVRSVVIYATLPIGRIVGQFDIKGVISDQPEKVWEKTRTRAGISRASFEAYFFGKKVAHAVAISKVKRYQRPIPLEELAPNAVAPRSFRYLSA